MSNLQIGRGVKTRAKKKPLKLMNTIKKIKKDKKTVNSKKDNYQGSPLEPFEALPPLFLETELNTRTFPYEHHYSNEDNEKDVAIVSDDEDGIYDVSFDSPVDQEDVAVAGDEEYVDEEDEDNEEYVDEEDEDNEKVYEEDVAIAGDEEYDDKEYDDKEYDDKEYDDKDLNEFMDVPELETEFERFGGTSKYNQTKLEVGTGIIMSLQKRVHKTRLKDGRPHLGARKDFVIGIILQDNDMGEIKYLVDGEPGEKLNEGMRVKFNIIPGKGARNVIPIDANNITSDPSSTTSSLSSLQSSRSSSRRARQDNTRYRENNKNKEVEQANTIQYLISQLQQKNYELQQKNIEFYNLFQLKDLEISNLHNEYQKYQTEMTLYQGPKQYCHDQKGIFLNFEDDGEVGNRIGYIRELDGQSKFMVHEYDLIHNNNNNKFDPKPGTHVTYSIEHHGYIGPTKAMFVKPRGIRKENEHFSPTHKLSAEPQKRNEIVNDVSLNIDEGDPDDTYAMASVNSPH